MKKSIYALAALLSVVACQKGETTKSVDLSKYVGEIVFSTGNSTKSTALTEINTTLGDRTFYVSSLNEEKEGEYTKTYLDNTAANYDKVNNVYATGVFLPQCKMKCFAIYPKYGINLDTTTPSKPKGTIDYEQSPSTDLLYGSVEADGSAVEGSIKLTFHHALGQIRVGAVVDERYSSYDNTTINLKKIYVVGYTSKGTLSINDGTWTGCETSATEVEYYEITDPMKITKSEQPIGGDNYGQSYIVNENTKLKIDYEVLNDSGTKIGGGVITSDAIKLTAGYRSKVKLIFNPSDIAKITFEVTVDEWKDMADEQTVYIN